MKRLSELSVFFPAYNEEGRLGQTVKKAVGVKITLRMFGRFSKNKPVYVFFDSDDEDDDEEPEEDPSFLVLALGGLVKVPR